VVGACGQDRNKIERRDEPLMPEFDSSAASLMPASSSSADGGSRRRPLSDGFNGDVPAVSSSMREGSPATEMQIMSSGGRAEQRGLQYGDVLGPWADERAWNCSEMAKGAPGGEEKVFDSAPSAFIAAERRQRVKNTWPPSKFAIWRCRNLGWCLRLS
jgi:hypothetical protein